MQFFSCYTSRSDSEDLLNLLVGTKQIFSKDKNIILGMVIIIDLNWAIYQYLPECNNDNAVENTIADELIKKLTFTDVDETAKFCNTIRACQFYHPQAFKEPL